VNPRVLKSGHSFKKGFHCLFAMCRGFGGSSFWPLVSFLFGLGMLISAAYWLIGFLVIFTSCIFRPYVWRSYIRSYITSLHLSLSLSLKVRVRVSDGCLGQRCRLLAASVRIKIQLLNDWCEKRLHVRVCIYIYICIHSYMRSTYVRTYIHVNHER